MSALSGCGFLVTEGPFPASGAVSLSEAYDAACAASSEMHVKHGSSNTRFPFLHVVDRKPFRDIYLHPELLAAASALIGPMQLSSFHGRTLRPHTRAEQLHQDVTPGADGYPLVGFILMVDEFRVDNGATRFLPGSQGLPQPPRHAAETCVCGPAGALLIFDGTTWHGHGANLTAHPRRSIQGAFVPKGHGAATRWRDELSAEQTHRLPPAARDLLGFEKPNAPQTTSAGKDYRPPPRGLPGSFSS